MMSFPGTIRERGLAAEARAEQYLVQQGLIPLRQRYRCRYGEIDLIMDDNGALVFVEVRYRKNHRFGSAAESVDNRKQQRIITTARHYLKQHVAHTVPICRFDVLALSGKGLENIEWIKDAFQAS